MKYWLPGVLALCVATGAAAENYQLVYSPSLKLEIWIDNVKNKNAASWCAREVPLRIVSRESKDPKVLNAFLPRVAGLMSSECGTLRTLNWQMNDSEGTALAQGNAQKSHEWAVEVTPPAAPAVETPAVNSAPPAVTSEPPATTAEPVVNAAPPPPPPPRPEDLSPAADTTPWLQFSLINGCHFRTWWNDNGQTSALFVPGKAGLSCAGEGWLNGQSMITRMGKGAPKTTRVTFLSGFPVEGLKKSDDALHITTVNNERMVLSNDKSPQSWLILPWQNDSSSWDANGVIAIQMSQQEASDSDMLKARLNEVRKSWGSYLSSSDKLSIELVETLSPQLKDPAAGAFRTLK